MQVTSINIRCLPESGYIHGFLVNLVTGIKQCATILKPKKQSPHYEDIMPDLLEGGWELWSAAMATRKVWVLSVSTEFWQLLFLRNRGRLILPEHLTTSQQFQFYEGRQVQVKEDVVTSRTERNTCTLVWFYHKFCGKLSLE